MPVAIPNKLNLVTNQFKLTLHNKYLIHIYSVQFSPENEAKLVADKLI
jgi:hypothetical protein